MENKILQLKIKNGELLCGNVKTATHFFSRLKGLMFSKKLPDCDGFLIKPCNSIHTFFMHYPIDVVFLDKNYKVVKIIYNLNPWRMTLVYLNSHQVLEMKAGTLNKNLTEGEIVEAICIN